ncbi:putative alpha/beta hydrolase [Streptomyces glaucescens]
MYDTNPSDGRVPLRWAVISLAATVVSGLEGCGAAVVVHSLGANAVGMAAAATVVGVWAGLGSLVKLSKIIGQ